MKFIVDAQLPKRLAHWLVIMGHDALHTLDFPNGNMTTDIEIVKLSLTERRVVISKDNDFYNRYLQKCEPYKLIFLTVGNLSTKEIMTIFQSNWDMILSEIEQNHLLEITRTSLITID